MKTLEYRNFFYYFPVGQIGFIALHCNTSLSLELELCCLNLYCIGGEKIFKILATVIQGPRVAKQVS